MFNFSHLESFPSGFIHKIHNQFSASTQYFTIIFFIVLIFFPSHLVSLRASTNDVECAVVCACVEKEKEDPTITDWETYKAIIIAHKYYNVISKSIL